MTEFEFSIAERIRQSMKARGITQQDLADSLGLKQYSISRMLSGAPFFNVEQLCAIAKKLDVSVYYLLGVQEESYRELSSDARKVADAYANADETVKTIICRILGI